MEEEIIGDNIYLPLPDDDAISPEELRIYLVDDCKNLSINSLNFGVT